MSEFNPADERFELSEACKEIDALRAENTRLRRELEELTLTLDLMHDASVRATKLWRKEDPEGRRLTLPDLSEHIFWAFTELETMTARIAALEKVREAAASVLRRRGTVPNCPVCAEYNEELDDALRAAQAELGK